MNADDFFASRDFKVLPDSARVGIRAPVPSLIDEVVPLGVKDSNAVDVASLFGLADINISDATGRVDRECLQLSELGALACLVGAKSGAFDPS